MQSSSQKWKAKTHTCYKEQFWAVPILHGILLHQHSPRGTGRHRWVVSSDWPILGPPPTLASSHWVDSDTKAHWPMPIWDWLQVHTMSSVTIGKKFSTWDGFPAIWGTSTCKTMLNIRSAHKDKNSVNSPPQVGGGRLWCARKWQSEALPWGRPCENWCGWEHGGGGVEVTGVFFNWSSPRSKTLIMIERLPSSQMSC